MPTIIPRDKEWTMTALRVEDIIAKRGISYATFAREIMGKKKLPTEYSRLWRNIKQGANPTDRRKEQIVAWLEKWEAFMQNAPK